MLTGPPFPPPFPWRVGSCGSSFQSHTRTPERYLMLPTQFTLPKVWLIFPSFSSPLCTTLPFLHSAGNAAVVAGAPSLSKLLAQAPLLCGALCLRGHLSHDDQLKSTLFFFAVMEHVSCLHVAVKNEENIRPSEKTHLALCSRARFLFFSCLFRRLLLEFCLCSRA